jgi:hypothetical protein
MDNGAYLRYKAANPEPNPILSLGDKLTQPDAELNNGEIVLLTLCMLLAFYALFKVVQRVMRALR